MEHDMLVKMVDQLEDSCKRIEESRKDVDLMVIARILHLYLKEELKNFSKK